MFNFAIMGAGGISAKFCDAVRRIPGCRVAAVASKSSERAEAFAERESIPKAYCGYEEMLQSEDIDCVYIGTDTGAHFRLTMLCLENGVPVLCEKAMFRTAEEARAAIRLSKEKHVFMMEAMWSYFLPAIRTAKRWIREGRIGAVHYSTCTIGFRAPETPGNRYFTPALGGGATYDITVYAYDLTTLLLGHAYTDISAYALKHKSGVDSLNQITLKYRDCISTITTSFLDTVEEELVLYGEKGKIVVPTPHYASRAMRFDETGGLLETYTDTVTENGFVYETEEVMRCIAAGRTESEVVPHSLSLEAAEVYDRLHESME